MKKLAIITSHPIQYNAPLFKELEQRNNTELKVFYTWSQSITEIFDPGFSKIREWDIPLLDGYKYEFVENISKTPGSHHFKGIENTVLIAKIELYNPDAILLFGWSFKSHLKVLRYFKGKKKILFRGDSNLLDEVIGFSFRKIIRRVFLKWVYSHIDFAFYVGVNNKNYFLAHGVKEAQLIYAPHAIDIDRFSEPDEVYQKNAVTLRENVGIELDDLVILFAGKLEMKKNPLFLVNLLKIITDKRIKILFVGSGELLAKIKSAAATDNRIILLGFQNQQQMPVIYRTCDLFILPSKGPDETWGLALNEAMASGRAVVATNKVGGAADLIHDGINGLIIDLQKTDSLQQLIKQSLIDKEVLREMGRQSSLKISSFNFKHIATAIEGVVNGTV